MNRAKLRENIGKALTFQPRPKIGNAYIAIPRNRWILISEEEKGLAVLNVITNHEFVLPFDSIRDYREPEILILRSQIVLSDNGGVELAPFLDAPTDALPPIAATKFQGPLRIGWTPTDFIRELQLPSICIDGLPSQKEEERIRSALQARLQQRAAGINDHVFSITQFAFGHPPFKPAPYEARSIEILEENLAQVKKDFAEHDEYELFEARAHKLNVHLLNEGTEYIEDASIQLDFERCPGFIIAKEIRSEPSDHFSMMAVSFTPRMSREVYPQVTEAAEKYSVYQEIGHIKHGITTQAFEVPLRIIVGERAQGQIVKVRSNIRGKNLESHREAELSIRVI